MRSLPIEGFVAEDLEVSAAESILFRFYSDEVSSQMASDLGVDVKAIRAALDRALCWSETGLLPIHPTRPIVVAAPEVKRT